MKWLANKLIVVSVLLLLVLVAGAALLYRILNAGIDAAVEYKSAKTTSATVVSTSKSLADASHQRPLYTICFTLDGLDQLEARARLGYETAERQRERISGPRCKTTSVAGAGSIKTGDTLQIVYLLANDYRIEIAAIRAKGIDLGPEGEDYSGTSTNRE